MMSWLVEEVGDVETELAGTERGRGGDGGRGVTVARLRLRSGSRRRGSRRGGRVRERVRERSGLRGVVRGVASEAGEEAGGGQGKQEVAEQGVGGARGGVAVSVLLAGRKTTGEGGGSGLGQREELGQVSGRQVGGPGGLLSLSISVFISLFYFCNLFLI